MLPYTVRPPGRPAVRPPQNVSATFSPQLASTAAAAAAAAASPLCGYWLRRGRGAAGGVSARACAVARAGRRT